MLNSRHLHRHHLLRSILSAILTFPLLCSLFSCSVKETNLGKEEETSNESTTISNSSAEENTLLYYTALVSRLETEILQLKEEIFLLQHQGNLPVDRPTDAESSSPTAPTEATDYTYEIINGGAVITSYCGKGGDVVLPLSLGGYPVVQIGDSAFAKTAVTSIVLPDTVTTIDWFAFRDCLSLTTIVGGDGVTEIGYGAFDGCPAALVVICPKGSYLAAYAASFGIAVRNR